MANVIIKTDQQKAAEAKILIDFGKSPSSATKQQREYAQEIARRTIEIKEGMGGKNI